MDFRHCPNKIAENLTDIMRVKTIRAVGIVLTGIILSYYTFFPIANWLLEEFSTVKYTISADDFNPIKLFYFVIIYFPICFFFNIRTCKTIGNIKLLRLIIFNVLDLLIVPLSILILIIYNNKKNIVPTTNELINFYLIGIMVVLKHLIILITYNKFLIRQPRK